jgi:hypothetical protein
VGELISIGRLLHPEAGDKRHEAFESSVHYLVTGEQVGSGLSVREHICRWSLVGDGEVIVVCDVLGPHTEFYSDGRLPKVGEWSMERAAVFCETIVYGPLPAIWRRIVEQEYIFDNDDEDIEEMVKLLFKELCETEDVFHARRLKRLIKKVCVSG